jgi:putative ABC transport system permease protein
MKYLGIGECDVIFGTSQTLTDSVADKTAEMAAMIATDPDVSKYAAIICRMFEMRTESGTVKRLRIELGDHSAFPIAYSKGREPQLSTEIALSLLNAEELEKTVGDEIILLISGEDVRLTVCGIYSDITNGGMTAKATFAATDGDVLWSSIPVIFNANVAEEAKISQYREIFTYAKISSVHEHRQQVFGSTIAAARIASYVAIAAAALITVLITLLFMKMLVTKDKHSIAILKSLGFSESNIKTQYKTRGLVILVIGVISGTILANTLGELVGVALISSFGASSFNFELNPYFAYLLSPLVIALCVYIATLYGISDIRTLKISEYIKEV